MRLVFFVDDGGCVAARVYEKHATMDATQERYPDDHQQTSTLLATADRGHWFCQGRTAAQFESPDLQLKFPKCDSSDMIK